MFVAQIIQTIKETFKGFDQNHFILPDRMILLLRIKAELFSELLASLFTNVDKCVHRQLGTRERLFLLLQMCPLLLRITTKRSNI